jgi:phage baseplate assembly protein W
MSAFDQSLREPEFMAFPLRVGPAGPDLSRRVPHVRELIEQLLFTGPGERVFRPEFGAGLRGLVFEPAGSTIAEVLSKRVRAALADILEGEVDPRTLEVEIVAGGERVELLIGYTLATVGRSEQHRIALGGTGG